MVKKRETDTEAYVYSLCDGDVMIILDAIRVPWTPGKPELLSLRVLEPNFKDTELPEYKGRGKISPAGKMT